MIKIGNIELGEFPLLLAPMEDVSDPPFRILCKEQGADLLFTEFISSEGLIRDAAKSVKKLDIFPEERPVGIQIFGSEIDAMVESARIISAVNPDLIDINYGCPVKKVTCKGAGASLLLDIPKMVKMTEAIVKATHLPVTVKTRLGWDEENKNIVEVAERLQDIGIQALSIHGRTRVQMYKGQAAWELIAQVKQNPRIKIPIFGNGDIDSAQKALLYKEKYGIDGIMIGRASIGYPWIFREIKSLLQTGIQAPPPTLQERIDVVRKHLQKEVEWKGEREAINEMKRHYTNYFKGFSHFKEFRQGLVLANHVIDIEAILAEIEQIKFVL